MAINASARGTGNTARHIKDRLVASAIVSGGLLVLITLLLIFFYLAYIVFPVFTPVKVELQGSYRLATQDQPVLLGMEEQNEIGFRFGSSGQVAFFSLDIGDPAAEAVASTDSSILLEAQIPHDAGITAAAHASENHPLVVYGFSDGTAILAAPEFTSTFPNDRRVISPALIYPAGMAPILIDDRGQPLSKLAVAYEDNLTSIVALTEEGRVLLVRLVPEEDFLSGELTWTTERQVISDHYPGIDQILMTPNQKRLFIRRNNLLDVFDISGDQDATRPADTINLADPDAMVTTVALLSGASSLLVGHDNGLVTQWFEVNENGQQKMTRIREFDANTHVTRITPAHYRKGFMTINEAGELGIYHATGNASLYQSPIASGATMLAQSPRANGALVEANGSISFYHVENEHPEVTWSALWQKVWYEGYSEPSYTWQSSSASDDFEAKLSLVPLSFGTIKAAFYAMLVAVPLALSAAIYVAYFMSPALRGMVKPTLEIVEALPTVILGFLAGLWLAPVIESNLPAVLTMIIVFPLGFLLIAFLWSKLPKPFLDRIPEGWQAVLLIPAVIFIGWAALELSPTLENYLMNGDARAYITNELGITFDQRNAMVVGIIMGFAVIPGIFSIAEDAIFSVPRHLTNGSLALGATPWQTLTRVVLLTATPGLFSAVMMGLGRAVGETMIVLMATGNTPIMDWNLFEGMRTLSANIAVEMPEAEVGSSHYRVLFLSALVLFIITFLVNTIAELVRQRLREKYSSM